jgi:hypothetical protein
MENKNLFGYIDNVELSHYMKENLITGKTVKLQQVKSSAWKNFVALGSAAAVICAVVIGGYVFLNDNERNIISPGSGGGIYTDETATYVESDISPDYPAFSNYNPPTLYVEEMFVYIEETEIETEIEYKFKELMCNDEAIRIKINFGDVINARNRDNPLGFEIIPYFPERNYFSLYCNFANLSMAINDENDTWADISMLPIVTLDEWMIWERTAHRFVYEIEYPQVVEIPLDSEFYEFLNLNHVYYVLGGYTVPVQWLFDATGSELIRLLWVDDEVWIIENIVYIDNSHYFSLHQYENGDWDYARG